MPGFANVIPVALNIGVASDAETQEMRRLVVRRLMMILGFGMVGAGMRMRRRTDGLALAAA